MVETRVGRACAATSLLVLAALIAAPPAASAQTVSSFKVAYYNIKSGKGQVGLTGTRTFADTSNCTDPSKPLNAWGVGLVQQHLVTAIRNDPSVVALGLGEAWSSVCGSPANVQQVLGWKERSSERNGVAMIARFGFAGPEVWAQLDTSQNLVPNDTKWVLKRDVCLNAACTQSIPVFVGHWLAYRTIPEEEIPIYDIQAQQTVDFLVRTAGVTPHVFIADLNVWEGPSKVCTQLPNNSSLNYLRNAGYRDAWPLVHGSAEGFTGMVNRSGCGNPVGYAWKRIDYAWAPAFFQPLSITRFGVVSPGIEAPSDHYGLIVEYPVPTPQGIDSVAPSVRIASPTGGTFAAGATIGISVEASDNVGVTRVEIVENGAVRHTLTAAPYQVSCTHLGASAGTHTLTARAHDAAGNIGVSSAVQVTVQSSPSSPTPGAAGPGDIVVHAKDAVRIAGNWKAAVDATAAGGVRMWNPDAGIAKLGTALAQPADFIELKFQAQAGVAYRIWMRGRAEADNWNNDSAFFQFSNTVTATGAPTFRIGTTSATWLGVEACSGCGLRNWGWNDNGYGGLGPLIYFATSGEQTVRIQRREDGLSIDQILLSPSKFLTAAPGARLNDATIYGATGGSSTPVPSAAEVLITANDVKKLSGGWQLLPDTSAAHGLAFGHPDAGAAKLTTALASPVHYVELTFHAEAGRAYRLWVRGRADKNHWANDSVFVQFDRSVTTSGQTTARIGTTSSYEVNLEEASHWGLSGWGWQDNGWGAGVLGPLVSFAATGTQTIRIQTREDGLRIDQVVLSSGKYLTTAPGALKNDTTILK